MYSIEGFVLAGGASSRMGRNKAQLVLGGQSFVERIARALLGVAEVVSIVGPARAGGDETFKVNGVNLPVIPDVFAQWGALGGLHAALAAARNGMGSGGSL